MILKPDLWGDAALIVPPRFIDQSGPRANTTAHPTDVAVQRWLENVLRDDDATPSQAPVTGMGDANDAPPPYTPGMSYLIRQGVMLSILFVDGMPVVDVSDSDNNNDDIFDESRDIPDSEASDNEDVPEGEGVQADLSLPSEGNEVPPSPSSTGSEDVIPASPPDDEPEQSTSPDIDGLSRKLRFDSASIIFSPPPSFSSCTKSPRGLYTCLVDGACGHPPCTFSWSRHR